MAIVLDDYVQSAPRINEKIGGGSARITMGRAGGKSFDEWLADAQTLALVLKAGALPAPVTVGEIRQVGASLGDELIKKGSLAALVGLALVVLFMAVYYKKTGLIADVALVLNGLLILAGLALFNATLTLPGIAGFVLTLGIAVDANVLINERIREELDHGKTARQAVDQGYDRAFWTIFDAHVTTLIAGFILFATGTGPDPRLRHDAHRRPAGVAVHLHRGDARHHHLLRPRPQRPDGLGLRKSRHAHHQAQDEHRLHQQAQDCRLHLLAGEPGHHRGHRRRWGSTSAWTSPAVRWWS